MNKTMISKAQEVMHQHHDGVKYGGGLVMSDQVQGTVDKIDAFYNGENKEDILTAAYLHKCLEKKRVNPELLIPYTLTDVEKNFGPKVAAIVSEISSEPHGDALKAQIASFKESNPETDLTDKQIEWTILSDWAKGLSKETQVILLAEKLQNYEVSLKNPNSEKPVSWHREYYETRQIMVEAIKDASPALYKQCRDVKEIAMEALFYEDDMDAYLRARNSIEPKKMPVKVVSYQDPVKDKAIKEAKGKGPNTKQ